MEITVHTMEYHGGPAETALSLPNYTGADYGEYRTVYNRCFLKMRAALHRAPLECCREADWLMENREHIFVYRKCGALLGSVAIYGNEIDDLIVAEEFQGNGYGRELLMFAVACMQKRNTAPIRLHVADWNRRAVKLYQSCGFEITETRTIG